MYTYKRFIKALLAFSGVIVLLWLAGACCAWDINPGNWDALARTMGVLVGGIFSAWVGVGVYLFSE